MARKASGGGPLYYKIGEACKALGIQPYVLRYWETEFPALNPNKSKSGQRVYSQAELEIIRRIKELLYDEGYTIAGAKKRLEQELEEGALGSSASTAEPRPANLPGASPSKAPSVPVPTVDAGLDLETYRRGIRLALDQTKEILEILASRP